jgi:transposase-like protein
MRTRKPRKIFSPVFKKEIAEKVMSSSETYSAIARQYGVANHQVARWAKEYLNQDTLWVQELNAHFSDDSKVETIAEHIEKADAVSNGLQSFNELIPHEESDRFSVDVSLPSGTKVSISNLTTDQLQAVLRICQ